MNIEVPVYFRSMVFITATTWKQPKCPSTDEWIKKNVVHIYNGILLSHIKELMPFEVTWMDDLEIFILSEVSQTEKDKCHISLTHGEKNGTNELVKQK